MSLEKKDVKTIYAELHGAGLRKRKFDKALNVTSTEEYKGNYKPLLKFLRIVTPDNDSNAKLSQGSKWIGNQF